MRQAGDRGIRHLIDLQEARLPGEVGSSPSRERGLPVLLPVIVGMRAFVLVRLQMLPSGTEPT